MTTASALLCVLYAALGLFLGRLTGGFGANWILFSASVLWLGF